MLIFVCEQIIRYGDYLKEVGLLRRASNPIILVDGKHTVRNMLDISRCFALNATSERLLHHCMLEPSGIPCQRLSKQAFCLVNCGDMLDFFEESWNT